jgi:dienelactone hydrolase
VVLPDFQGTYARRSASPATVRRPDAEAFRDRVVQSAKDLSRTIDYLETRPDIDATRVAFYAFSVGGALLALPTMEPRLKSVLLLSAGLPRRALPPEIEPVNMAPRLRTPLLLLGGRYDYLAPIESAQKPLFDRIGTPARLKRHVIFESGHVPERVAVIREVLDWLDGTLGPVTRAQR